MHKDHDASEGISRRATLLSALGALSLTAAGWPAWASELSSDRPDGAADFDFLIGHWDVTHRRLRQRLVGDTDWETFGGTCDLAPILGGLGNLDQNVLNFPSGRYQACSLRLFDETKQQWGIWWIDARMSGIGEPVFGSFAGGIGTFFGTDTHNGQAVDVRFLWSRIMPHSCRWEQAFSVDGGTSWETNWFMDFARRETRKAA